MIAVLAFCDSARQRELNNYNNKIDYLDLICHDSRGSSPGGTHQMVVGNSRWCLCVCVCIYIYIYIYNILSIPQDERMTILKAFHPPH